MSGGTDVLEQAREHAWWHSDQSVANNLIHEIERLRSELNMAVVAKHEAEDKADEMFEGCMERTAEINRLRAIVADWESKTASPALSMLRMNSEISRLKSEAWAKDAEIARLREHFAIQAEGEADDARLI